jgi:hypothetical protein
MISKLSLLSFAALNCAEAIKASNLLADIEEVSTEPTVASASSGGEESASEEEFECAGGLEGLSDDEKDTQGYRRKRR